MITWKVATGLLVFGPPIVLAFFAALHMDKRS
jgi:hypothetical protein